MIKNRVAWFNVLFRTDVEGGLVDNPDDPGGLTNMGVTLATLSAWRKCPCTPEDIRGLTRNEAEDIALSLYWNIARADDLPGGVDLYLADSVWHMPVKNAVKMLQELVGTEADGFVGPKTIAATRSERDTAKLILGLHNARMNYLRSRPHWPKFAKGWTRRCELMRDVALGLVEPNLVEAGIPKSRVIWGSITGCLASLTALAPIWPDIRHAFETGQAAITSGDVAQAAIGIAGAAGTLLAIYARVTDYYRARHAGANDPAKEV